MMCSAKQNDDDDDDDIYKNKYYISKYKYRMTAARVKLGKWRLSQIYHDIEDK